MGLPAPTANQAFCNVSALDGGALSAAEELFIMNSTPGHKDILPSLCFLIQHSEKPFKFLFDLGIRRDVENYPPMVVERLFTVFGVETGYGDSISSLEKGGIKPDDIDFICISHLHWDHTGDTSAFKKSTFVVGAECRPLVENGYPKDPAAFFAQDMLPFDRHLNGHVNVLARTSADGAWIYLAGDSAHNWKLVIGESEIRVGLPGNPHFCMHHDLPKAEEHIGHIREVWKTPRVRVLLAHDVPWYKENKGGPAFWPGKIESL
ncbi:beta-lactamase-like protein [Gymnopilus junonius]|uniref:Beta-lactamase-like protein n=1 Tax=Gymnopilus junonius TaxID=109634 RepID=A0A9P5TPY4_GYMJU|nr:beta-lactamase-like protein [Gymnopilus junonius]